MYIDVDSGRASALPIIEGKLKLKLIIQQKTFREKERELTVCAAGNN